MAIVKFTENEILDGTVKSLKESLIRGEVLIAMDESGFQNVFKYIASDCAVYAFELKNHKTKLRAVVSDIFHFSPVAPGKFDLFIRTILSQYTDFVIDRFGNVLFDFQSESEGYVRHIVMR